MKFRFACLVSFLGYFLTTTRAIPTLPFIIHDSSWSVYTDVDNGCQYVQLPFTLKFGTSTQTGAFICSNGFIAFESGYSSAQSNKSFPINRMVVSPYWEDIYLKSDKGVYYKIFQNKDDLQSINEYLLSSGSVGNTVTAALVVKWIDVCPNDNNDCDKGNSFQIVLCSNDDESFAVFTYKCGELNWSRDSVTIGYSADSNFYRNHFLSRKTNVNDIACISQPESNWTNIVYKLSISVLAFMNLKKTAGSLMGVFDEYVTIELPEDLQGVKFGNATFSTVFVSSTGLLSFGHSYVTYVPETFPITAKVIAPYWDDINIPPDGALYYEVVTNSSIINEVNNFLKLNQSIDFNASVIVVAKWNRVAPIYYSGKNDIDDKNSFQAVIATDQSIGTYSVFSYHCDYLNWIHYNASIGFSESNSFYANHPLSRTTSVNNISCFNQPAIDWTNVVYHVSKSLKILQVSKNLTVVEGSYKTLYCEAFGNPTPSIEWSSDSYDIQTGGVITEEVYHDHIVISTLTLEVSKNATFNCTAGNNESVEVETITATVQTLPAIASSPIMLNVPQGDSITVSCSANGYPIPTVYWEKDGLNTNLMNDSNIHESTNTFEHNNTIISTLHINTTIYSSGQYVCYAENSLARLEVVNSTLLTLFVHIIANIVSHSRQAINILEGSKATLECTAEGVPRTSFMWLFNKYPVINIDYKNFTESVSIINESFSISKLHFPSVSIDDAGSYVCSACNEYGCDNQTTILNIQVTPVITSQDSQWLYVNFSQSVRISCSADGYPVPTVHWTKDNETLASTIATSSTIKGSTTISTITIDNSTYENNGKYFCHASNQLAQMVTKTLFITMLKVNPLIAEIRNNLSNLTVAEGTKLNLNCTVYGLPTPIVNWYRDDVRIDENHTTLSHLPGHIIVKMLTIFPLRKEDSGSYYCAVKQAVSATEWTYQNSTSIEVTADDQLSVGGLLIVVIVLLIVITLVMYVTKYRHKSYSVRRLIKSDMSSLRTWKFNQPKLKERTEPLTNSSNSLPDDHFEQSTDNSSDNCPEQSSKHNRSIRRSSRNRRPPIRYTPSYTQF